MTTPDVPLIANINGKHKRALSESSNFGDENPPRKLTRLEKELQSDLKPSMILENRCDDEPGRSYYLRKSERKRSHIDSGDNPAGFDRETYKRIKAYIAQLESEQEFTNPESAFSCFPGTEIPIPRSYDQAIADSIYGEKWKKAVSEGLDGIFANGTFEEEIPPDGANIVGMKWIFTIKFLYDGSIERFKARLVVRGFSQIYGQDFTETFAPTVWADTLQVFLTIVAAEDLEAEQFDIKLAFTEATPREYLYCRPPAGVPIQMHHVWRPQRSLYGLKQAARDWNQLARSFLLQIGFKQSSSDPYLFTLSSRQLILLLYFDDISISARDSNEIRWFEKLLTNKFKTTSLGEMKKILGMRITRERSNRTLYLDQKQYLETILDRFGINEPRRRGRFVLLKGYDLIQPSTSGDVRVNASEYQQIIGSMTHAMVYTRPDICYSTGKFSQFMSYPVEHHAYGAKGVLQYLKDTVDSQLRFGPVDGQDDKLSMFSDADLASDRSDRKSTSGFAARLYGGLVSWGSRKLTSVATSSTESEYVSQPMCAKQAFWLGQVLRDIGYGEYIGKIPSQVHMMGDNQGAIALAKDPRLHEQSKHIVRI
ncbi:hypothetical protein K3495_g6279 [Podosphaera aphanis]|nr:hypothetical protein K3495_g6279 [Podosphaera aphanis]